MHSESKSLIRIVHKNYKIQYSYYYLYLLFCSIITNSEPNYQGIHEAGNSLYNVNASEPQRPYSVTPHKPARYCYNLDIVGARAVPKFPIT